MPLHIGSIAFLGTFELLGCAITILIGTKFQVGMWLLILGVGVKPSADGVSSGGRRPIMGLIIGSIRLSMLQWLLGALRSKMLT
jgi:hypothetical protein